MKEEGASSPGTSHQKNIASHIYVYNFSPTSSDLKCTDKGLDSDEEICEATPCSVAMCDQSVVDWVQCDIVPSGFTSFVLVLIGSMTTELVRIV